MMNHIKTVSVSIGLLGLCLATASLAGDKAYCNHLYESGSLHQEPTMCDRYSTIQQKALPVTKNVRGGSPSTSFIYESRSSDTMATHPVGDFSVQTALGVVLEDIFAMAFDANGSVLYGLENTNKNLVSINQSSGVTTIIGPLTNVPVADTMTGLDVAPDGTCYATSTDGTTVTLYTCNLSTGELTVVGTQTDAPLVIGIAADCQGTLYAHDIGDDNIYTINTSTAAVTVVGPTGLDANFAQDITYDRNQQQLYGYIYTGAGTNTYGTINACTGAVSAINVDNPLGEYYGASKTSCTLSDVIFRNGLDC